MAYLLAPSDDAHLRMSFIAAQREYLSTGGRTDSGLSVKDLASNTIWSGYVRGLREGTLLRPGMTPLRCCEWWWVEHGLDGPEFIGRISLMERPAPQLDEISWSIRPTQHDKGHEEALVEAVRPILASRGLPHVAIRCSALDRCSCVLIERMGGRPLRGTGDSAKYLLPTREMAH